jgi:regulator of sigma E protease
MGDPQTIAFYIVTFLVALGVLIVVHEVGHFLVAKWIGVRVLRFSVGFGPIIFSRRRGDTEYALSAVPLGGYVKMLGEDDGEEFDLGDAARAFSARPLGHRAAIVAAGPLFNLGFAVVLYIALHLLFGVAVPSNLPRVAQVTPGLPAAAAGLTGGDLITAVDGEPVATWDELSERIRASQGRALTVAVRRGEEAQTLSLTPQRQESKDIFGEVTGEIFVIGVVRDIEMEPVGPVRAVALGFERTWTGAELVCVGLWRMVTGRVSPRELGGPIAIAKAAGQQAELGAGPFLNSLAFLSVNLGVLNLLPIPVLDGGHLLFFLIELLLRRPLRPRQRELAQQMGLLLLLTLMVFVFYNDIQRLLQG